MSLDDMSMHSSGGAAGSSSPEQFAQGGEDSSIGEISQPGEISRGSESSVNTEISAPQFEVTASTNERAGGSPQRHWVFTIQCDALDEPAVHALRRAWRPPTVTTTGGKGLRYIVCQQEVGHESGRLHWQGYLQCGQPTRASGVRTLLSCPWAWVKPARGNAQQARAYCMKEDTRLSGSEPHESGSIAVEAQGKRNDLAAVASMVKDGKSLADIASEHAECFMRYHSGIMKYMHVQRAAQMSSLRRPDLQVIVIWGPPGSGKSRWAWDTYPDLYNLAVGSSQTVWWDGYEGQETVLIDDFQGGIPFRLMLNYLDVYAIQAPVKGSMVWLSFKRIVITSNLFYADWYSKESQRRDMSALQRRITDLWYMSALGAEPETWRRGDAGVPAEWVPVECPVAQNHSTGFVPPS